MSAGSPMAPRLRDHPGAVASLLALSVLGTAYEILPASITPLVVADMGVDATAVNALVSAMLGVAVVASVPAGGLIDRIDHRRAVGLAAALFVLAGIGSWAAARAGTYEWILAMRLLAGVGFVVVWNAGVDVFGRFRRPATATSLFTASGPIGFAVGHVTGPLFAESVGWPVAFLVYPLLTIAPAAYVVLGGAGPVRDAGVDVPRIGEYGRLLRNRTVVILCLLGFLSYSLYLFVNSWMPTYLATELDVSLAGTGFMVAAFPLMGGVARLSGGVITDRLLAGRRRPVVVASFVVAVPLLVANYVSSNVVVLAGILVVLGFFIQLSLGLFYSYVPEVLPTRFATSGVALLTSVSLGGAFSAPLVAGMLIDYTGTYLAAFGYAVGLAIVGTVLALFLVEPGR